MRIVNLLNHLVVESIAGNDARIDKPFFKKTLIERPDKPAKDIARAEMNPFRMRCRALAYGSYIECGQFYIGLFPGGLFISDLIKIKFHS